MQVDSPLPFAGGSIKSLGHFRKKRRVVQMSRNPEFRPKVWGKFRKSVEKWGSTFTLL